MTKRKRQRDFLKQLAGLCWKYKASFTYTTDDDGIHIQVEGEEVFVGYLNEDAANLLRDAAQ